MASVPARERDGAAEELRYGGSGPSTAARVLQQHADAERRDERGDAECPCPARRPVVRSTVTPSALDTTIATMMAAGTATTALGPVSAPRAKKPTYAAIMNTSLCAKLMSFSTP